MLPAIKTILYATGLSQGSPYIFRYALTLARQHQAKIVVVHAIEPLTSFGQSLVEQYMSHDASEELHSKARETVKGQIKGRIEKLCTKECSGTAECSTLVTSIQVVDGYPDQVILEAAKASDADVIVMGSQRHNLLSEVMLGSTTRKVLHNALQPVFVVRVPKGFAEAL